MKNNDLSIIEQIKKDYEKQYYDYYNVLKDRLYNMVVRIKWNINIIQRIEKDKLYLSNNDIEIHKARFVRYINELHVINKEWEMLDYNYCPVRINKINHILIKVMNYEFKKP